MIVLGVNCSHDAGAALIQDGSVVAAINEERLNRKKAYGGFPVLSIPQVLEVAGVSGKDIDAVAVSNIIHLAHPPVRNDFRREDGSNLLLNTIEYLDKVGLIYPFFGTGAGVELYRFFFSHWGHSYLPKLKRLLLEYGINAAVECVDHHLAHAASVAFCSGWERSLVVSNDGFGDGYCNRTYIQDGLSLKEIGRIPMYHSLGVFYNFITLICGFPKYYHVGKTTGLAAIGNVDKTIGIFRDEFGYDRNSMKYINKGKIFGNEIARLKKKLAGVSREDIAAGVQQHLEDVMLEFFAELLKEQKERRIGLAGGIHGNVKLNQRIASLAGVEEVIVHPNMSDGGLAVGAALQVWAQEQLKRGNNKPPKRLRDVYLGPDFDDKDVEKAIQENPGDYKATKGENRAFEIAKRLADNKVLAFVDGRMEYGPRALCHRTIMYPATDRTVNNWLNKQLARTEFMPFAPVVQYENASDLFKNFNQKTAYTAEFMTITYDVTDKFKRCAPAAVHVDGTARPQVLRKEINSKAYDILSEYKKLTGNPVLINTSFNMHEEPIVCTPSDAIRCFMKGHIDCLAIGSYVLDQRKAFRMKDKMEVYSGDFA